MPNIVIFTAPSGAGKTTIVRHLLDRFDKLAFSVSATTRPRRPHEQHGRDYYFLSPEAFMERVARGDFIEWEEVYPGQYYGTLREELERLWDQGKDVLFDIDVKGAWKLKQAFPKQSLAVFVMPPSKEVLFQRLRSRHTESEESLRKRMARAAAELEWAPRFDHILINDRLEDALLQAEQIVSEFLGRPPRPPQRRHAHIGPTT